MTTFNTGNKLGSTDPRDLYDNAENFDGAMNGTGKTWTDRFGNERHAMASIDGIIASLDTASFTFPDKNAGLEATSVGQYFRVPHDGGFIYYRHGSDGSAVEVAELLGKEALDKQLELLTADERPDVLATFSGEDMNVGLMFTAGGDGVSMLTNEMSITPALVENSTFFIATGTPDYPLLFTDADFNIIFGVDAELNVLNSVSSSAVDPVATLDSYANSLAAGESVPTMTFPAIADRQLNIIIVYGQSNSVGADTAYALTTTPMFGNLMLGQSVRGSNYSSGSTDYTYGPVGGSNTLYPLVEVVQSTTWGETGIAAMVNTLKMLHNRQMRMENDENRLFAGGSAGVSGATIEKLSPAAGKSWGRFTSMLSGFKEAADAAGYSVGSCGIVYIGNEADNAKTYDYYYDALGSLRADMVDAVKTTFGQNTTAHLVLTQYGGQFAYDPTNQASARAIVDFCDNNADVSFAGCHHQYPGPGAHIASNSYRWQFSTIGKVLQRAMNGTKQPTFRIVKVQHTGNKVYVAMKVPVPPITFRTAYNRWVATNYDDKGFTVTDSLGSLSGDDLAVEISAPNVLTITCSRTLIGEVRVTLGDQETHAGIHNIADSDPSVSPYSWEYLAGTAMPEQENIPDLNNKPYQLYNWCARDSIISEEI